MNNEISDLEICKKISNNLYNEYFTALEFISLNPDYSLLKFREAIDYIASLILEKNDINIKNESLFEKINILFESQIINHTTKDRFHEIRKLCNSGIHKELDFEGSKDFHKQALEKLKVLIRKKITRH
ncbi:MAG: DUF4145 domain-containing protein [Gammaproteobacteria bacterium]|nr:DUF4145 domain-containing protein [Gammaproteobacteria bacterium]